MDPVLFRRLRWIISVSWKRGRFILWLSAVTAAPFFFLASRIALRLDPLVFPRIRRVEVSRPVFIIAHPRSGTTYLQRLVSLHPEVASFRTWEMFFPSAILRRAVQPLVWLLRAIGLGRVQHARRGHEIRLFGVDEEEGLFLHHLDSELLTYVCPEGVVEPGYRRRFLQLGWNDRHGRREPVSFFREYLQRQLYLRGSSQVIVNTNPSVFRIKSLLREFPDARFVFLRRPPADTIPSYFSLLENTIGRRIPRERRSSFYRQKYRWSLHLYAYFSKMRGEIPADRMLELDFSDVVGSRERAERTLGRIFRLAGLEVAEHTWRAIREEMRRSLHRRAGGRVHVNYPLERFGLTVRDIERDFSFYGSGTV